MLRMSARAAAAPVSFRAMCLTQTARRGCHHHARVRVLPSPLFDGAGGAGGAGGAVASPLRTAAKQSRFSPLPPRQTGSPLD